MKRYFLLAALMAFSCCFVLAQATSVIGSLEKLDWFSLESAQKAEVPAGLTDREVEIYRAGYANGHYDALNPAYIDGMYVLNTKTRKFHLSNCLTTLAIDPENREHSTRSPEELIKMGYKPCGQCNPQRK